MKCPGCDFSTGTMLYFEDGELIRSAVMPTPSIAEEALLPMLIAQSALEHGYVDCIKAAAQIKAADGES